MKQPPGQDPGGIVEQKIPRDKQERSRDDGGVYRAYLPSAGAGFTRAPQAHTILRVAHWMFSSRPQTVQLR